MVPSISLMVQRSTSLLPLLSSIYESTALTASVKAMP